MKKISVSCPLVLNSAGASHRFVPGVEYEVEDAVAEHPYLAQYIATVVDMPKPKRGGKKKEPAPEEPPAPAEEGGDGTSDA